MTKIDRQIERRYVTSEVELRMTGGRTYIEGYAAVFGKRSGNLGGFVEVVENTAFTKTLNDKTDVRALFNHNANYILGRSTAGTLELSTDSNGLYYRALAPKTTYANDLIELLDRRDITQSSFAFWTVQDDWNETEDNVPLRHLKEVGLVDISPVTYPAYQDATSGVIREAALSGLAKRSGCQVGELCSVEAIRTAIRTVPTSEPQDSTRRSAIAADVNKEPEFLNFDYSAFVTPA